MKLIATFFTPSSSSHKSSGKSKKKPKAGSISRSNTPSFGSSASSGSSDSSASHHSPRSVILGRNASCLDAEYWPAIAADHSPKAASAGSDLFGVLDRDGDGKITKQELEQVLRRLVRSPDPPTEEEVEMMLAEVDRDGDGCISLEDLEALVGYRPGGSAGVGEGEEELLLFREAFGVFDADGDGRISAEELQRVFQTLGDEGCSLEECRRMIGGVDSRGAGFVCFEDFVRMMDGCR